MLVTNGPTPVVVASANSRVGSEVARQLLRAGVTVRALVRDTHRADWLVPLGAEVIRGDLDKPDCLDLALRNVESALLCTGASPRLVEQHARFVASAKQQGVRHIVRISVLGADLNSPVVLGRLHAQCECILQQSGLGFTHLRPHLFMQNFLDSMGRSAWERNLYGSMGTVRIPFVDVRDVAAVAVATLTGPGHFGKTYDLTGPKALSMNDVARELAARTGRVVTYVDLPPQSFFEFMVRLGTEEWLARDYATLHTVFAHGPCSTPTTAVQDITGRSAIPFERFVQDHAHMFRRG